MPQQPNSVNLSQLVSNMGLSNPTVPQQSPQQVAPQQSTQHSQKWQNYQVSFYSSWSLTGNSFNKYTQKKIGHYYL
jgi:hypothetical protein